MVLGPIDTIKGISQAIKKRPFTNGIRVLWAIILILIYVPTGAILVKIRQYKRKIGAYYA